MMKYEGNEKLKDQTKCSVFRANLKMCLLESECCKVHKITPKECLRSHPDLVPNECFAFRNGFYECKRSLIDNRRRFRGIKGHEDKIS
ncbi:cytochrome c oxidase assembly factor 5 [Leptopilina boulardi]|uniref:cytochrome c oxidase assembly factor 5 n=1 Tax=Leptopilina boulardi TaxID=63433 RepID=UPI0021F58A93|nr:cytochrome c oxidase assembly factor 5 [Leptopilina boulardi]XP_051154078.1 cytochrome c oxidase assembly factor 5 [Leptopilina boulardi]